jgi:predicted metal-dependent hydrolase
VEVLQVNASTGFNCLVQFDFFLKRPSSKTTDSIVVGDQNVPLLFVVNPRSKRYILRLKPDGSARVTIPRRSSLRAGREFAGRNVAWLSQQLQRLAAKPVRNKSWHIGSEILFRGETVEIVAGVGSASVTFADQTIRMTGTGDDLRPMIERHMRSLAVVEMPPRVLMFAQQHGLSVNRVTVRNQKSRWGSCSRRGTISLNWRLIQAPGLVADYVILHELMHIRQMSHSTRFWREVEKVCPDFREAEKWLKSHGRLLR